jgi:SAM-dependent methyltransferase
MFLDPVKFPARNAIFKLLFHRPLHKWVSFWLQDRKTEKLWKINKLDAINELRDQLLELPLNFGRTEWTDYSSVDSLDNLEKNEFTNKGKLVLELIDKVKPKSVIDLGSNKGIYSELVARNGVQVVATDIDEASITQLYFRAKKQGLNILPLRLDITRPTPAHGPWNLFSEAKNRLKCEFALALAITHHLVLRQRLSFDTVSTYLSSFAEKWLLVEFVEAEDIHVSRWQPKPEAWYTLENFKVSLGKNFKEITVFKSYVDHRYLLFCKK